MATKVFFGKTEKECLDNALTALNVQEDEISYEFEKEKGGILSFGSKKLKIIVTYSDENSKGNFAINFIKNLLERMNIIARIYLIEESNDKIHIEIESDESGLIIGKKGKNLEAIQLLTNVVVNKGKEDWIKVYIDSENYRRQKERNLKDLALKSAIIVKKTRRSKILEPMNPFDRRLIHLTLQDDDTIETKSEGEGIYKRVRILPKKTLVT